MALSRESKWGWSLQSPLRVKPQRPLSLQSQVNLLSQKKHPHLPLTILAKLLFSARRRNSLPASKEKRWVLIHHLCCINLTISIIKKMFSSTLQPTQDSIEVMSDKQRDDDMDVRCSPSFILLCMFHANMSKKIVKKPHHCALISWFELFSAGKADPWGRGIWQNTCDARWRASSKEGD